MFLSTACDPWPHLSHDSKTLYHSSLPKRPPSQELLDEWKLCVSSSYYKAQVVRNPRHLPLAWVYIEMRLYREIPSEVTNTQRRLRKVSLCQVESLPVRNFLPGAMVSAFDTTIIELYCRMSVLELLCSSLDLENRFRVG